MAEETAAADTGQHSIKADASTTEYVVLEKTSADGLPAVWRETGVQFARTPEAAMAKYAEKALADAEVGAQPLLLRAVPRRNWTTPVPFKVERQIVSGT